MANVLFSSNSALDIAFILKNIGELAITKQTSTSIVENRIRLVQTNIGEITKSISNISDHQEKIDRNYQILQSQVTINSLFIKTALLEQSIILGSLLNQYAYETQNLISIINSAIQDKIHSTVLPPSKLLKELKAIKLTLHAGTQLPLEPIIQNIPELLSISSATIIQKDTFLIFVLKFPIITANGYDMYHPIPLPLYIEDNNAILIDTEIDYISFSDDSEFYFTLTQQQSEACNRLSSYTICKSNEPIQRRASSQICEIEMLHNPQVFPISCKRKYINLNVSIWNRLTKTDSWIYCTRSESVTLSCKNPTNSFQVDVKGVGRINIAPSCTLHTTKAILLPILNMFINHTLDIIPENPVFSIDNIKKIYLNNVNSQTLSHIGLYKNLRQIVHETSVSRKSEENPLDYVLIAPIEYHIIIEYICIVVIIIIVVILSFKLKKQTTHIYKPDIAETEI